MKPLAFLAAVIFIVPEAIYHGVKSVHQNWQSKIKPQEDTPITIGEKIDYINKQYPRNCYKQYPRNWYNLFVSNSQKLYDDQQEHFPFHNYKSVLEIEGTFRIALNFFIALIVDTDNQKVKVFYHNLPTNITIGNNNITSDSKENWLIRYDGEHIELEGWHLDGIYKNQKFYYGIVDLLQNSGYTLEDGMQEMQKAILEARNTNQQFSLQ